jgi:oligopeptide transport system permease protein
MLTLIGRRLIQTTISLFVLVTLTFVLLKLFPGSPFDDEVSLHPSVQEQIENTYGLHQTSLQQYFYYIGSLLHGHFGVSQFFQDKSVESVLKGHLPTTFYLSVLSLLLSSAVAVCMAVVARLSQVGLVAYELSSLFLLSVPTLLAGPLLIYFFGFYWNLLPVALLERPTSYLLPVLVLSLKPTASLSRLLEAQLRENSTLDDLRMMEGLGVSKLRLLLKYNLKKSLIPFVSYWGGLAGVMLGGSAVVEIVFSIPGMGSQFIEAVLNRDTSLVIGLTLVYGFSIFTFQLLVDLTLPLLDPRLRKT